MRKLTQSTRATPFKVFSFVYDSTRDFSNFLAVSFSLQKNPCISSCLPVEKNPKKRSTSSHSHHPIILSAMCNKSKWDLIGKHTSPIILLIASINRYRMKVRLALHRIHMPLIKQQLQKSAESHIQSCYIHFFIMITKLRKRRKNSTFQANSKWIKIEKYLLLNNILVYLGASRCKSV